MLPEGYETIRLNKVECGWRMPKKKKQQQKIIALSYQRRNRFRNVLFDGPVVPELQSMAAASTSGSIFTGLKHRLKRKSCDVLRNENLCSGNAYTKRFSSPVSTNKLQTDSKPSTRPSKMNICTSNGSSFTASIN